MAVLNLLQALTFSEIRAAALLVLAAWLLVPLVKKFCRAVSNSWKLRNLPGPHAGLFGVASVLKTRPDRHRLYSEWTKQYGPVFKHRLFFRHTIVATDPKVFAEAVRCKELDKGQLKNVPIQQLASPKRHHTLLFGPTDERWKAVRKSVATAFSVANMRALYPKIRDACAKLADLIAEAGPDAVIDIDNALCRESLQVIGWVGFDRDMGATRALAADSAGAAMDATAAAMQEVEQRMRDPLRKFCLWRRDVRESRQVLARFHGIMAGLLAESRSKPPSPNSIAAHLLAITDPRTGEPMDDDHLIGEVATLFFAGFETTGHTAAWVVFCVSQAPDVEARIMEELRSLDLLATRARPAPRAIQWEDTGKLAYLNNVIKEAMRLYPAGGIATFRLPTGRKPVVLNGGKLVLPPGVILHTPIAAIQHSEANWERAGEFLPSRWEQAGAEDAMHAPVVGGRTVKRFVPFSEGVRDCVGQNLARLNLTTTLAQLYGSFSFRLAEEMGGPEGVRAAERTSITLSCANGMKVHALPRAHRA